MDVIIAITAIVALIGVMVLIGKVRRIRNNINELNSLRDYHNDGKNVYSQAEWERAAEQSRELSRKRHYG